MESDDDFVCSQISVSEYNSSQSADYGLDVVDYDGSNISNVVSLECENFGNCNVADEVESVRCDRGARPLYDNVVIEDISSDEEFDKM